MLALTRRLLEAAEGGEPVLLASVLEPGASELQTGARMLVSRSGERMGSLGEPALDELVAEYAPAAFPRHSAETAYVSEAGLTTRTVAGAPCLYLEVVESRPVFLVVGAGHIGRCLAKLAHFLDFYVAILDDREDFADPEKLPEADEVICEDYESALDRFPITSNTYVVMVTRGHKQDELSLRRVLGRGAGYVGMIGSKRRTTAVLEHLAAEGFAAEDLAAVHTPIGLDIGAETPEEIAVSILAEVILVRRGGSAKPMYYRRGERDS